VYLLSFGEFYLSTNKIDSALIQTQRSYELSMRIGYRDYLGAILQQLGSIHTRLGNSALAISYYNLAIEEGYKMKSPRFISSTFMAIAQYYSDASRNDSAIIYAKKSIAAVQNTAFSNMGIYPAKLLLDIYRNTNIDSAFKYSEIYRTANDSLFNAKTIQQTQLLAFEENVRQQRVAEEKVKEEEQRHQNIQYALITLSIIIFVILFLLLSRTVIVNERLISFFAILGLLVVFEFINLVLHPRLASFTHESPVLMLLALVLIASLLIPLHHRLEYWIKEKMVQKNKAIRLTAAKKTIERLEKKSENV
jgi:tetratricopeptide (TPR) repeat protein